MKTRYINKSFDLRVFASLRAIKIAAILFLFSLNTILAQTTDSLKKFETPKPLIKHSPKAAALMSAIVPGLGQVYNKKYWKVPVIYGGFIGLAYAFNFNQDHYLNNKTNYQNATDKDSSTVNTSGYSIDNLKTLINSYHRYRDLYAIGMATLYLINIIDASVDAHLFNFDVGDNLTLQVQPYVNTFAYHQRPPVGLSLTLHYRKIYKSIF